MNIMNESDAHAIHEVIAFTVSNILYENTGVIPDAEVVNSRTLHIFCALMDGMGIDTILCGE